MNRLTSFVFCTVLIGSSSAAIPCQSSGPAGSGEPEPAAQLCVRIDPEVVPVGQGATLWIHCGRSGGPFAVVASDQPVTAASQDGAAMLAQTGVVVATGRFDHRGRAKVALSEPAPSGRWNYTVLAFAAAPAPDGLIRSVSHSVLWLGGGGQIGIDTPPTVTYSTQFGSAGTQSSRFMTTDENGYIYLAGKGGPLVNPPGDQDPTGGTWIAKLDPSQNGPNGDLSIEWTTTFGGDAQGMNRYDIVAGGGRVFVCGWAIRGDLATGNVFDPTKNIFRDGYVAMFDAGTGARLATTYLSQQSSSVGQNTDPRAMALVGDDLYVAGWADHDGMWTTNGFDTTFNGGLDAFLMKLHVIAPDGLDLVWGTYLPGGGGVDRARSILVDAGSVYVAGDTDSTLALPGGGFQSAPAGGQDAFCLRILDGAVPALAAGTYLGGGKSDEAVAVSLDSSGDVWLGGTTSSTDFPVSVGAFDTALGGKSDAFVARLSPDLSTLLSASYFGGGGNDSGQGLAAHGGLVYLVGQTKSSDLPIVDPLPGGGSKAGREDAFFARLDANGQPVTSTYFGGNSTDSASAGLDVDSNGTAWFGGQMESNDVGLTSPTSYGGDFYVAGFGFAPPPPPPAAPSLLTATAVSSSAIDLTWVDNSADEAGFRIERSPDAIQWSAVATVGPNVTAHTDTGLTASTSYSYRAIAFNAGGDSPASNLASATTLAGPANPTITSITPNWMDAGSSIAGVAIAGSGFQIGAVVSFEAGQGPAPVPSNVVVSANQITLTITAGGGGPPGNRVWNVRVTNPDQGSATLPGGFTVIK